MTKQTRTTIADAVKKQEEYRKRVKELIKQIQEEKKKGKQ